MKKSLRQWVLIGLSGMLIAGAAAPMVLAQDDTEDQTEQVEETTEEEMVEEEAPEEETTEDTEESSDMTKVEASEAQMGVEEAVAIFGGEYPDASIEEIDVELDTEEAVYTIVIQGFDNEDNDYELEVEWVDGEVREQQFNEGFFNAGDGEDVETDNVGLIDTLEEPEDEPVETEDTVEDTEQDVPAESVPETDENADDTVQDVPAESVPETDDNNEAAETERLALDLENLVTLDEATDTAIQEVGAGEAVSWNLTADTSEWWEFWDTDEENENPLWIIEVEDTESGESEEVRIDAVTGEILNLEDVEPIEEEMTEETMEEAPEETVEEQPEEAPEETDTEE